jgi:protein-disulfide isomerase
VKTFRSFARLAVCGALSLFACQPSGPHSTATTGSSSPAAGEVIARVGDREIKLSEVDSAIESELKRLEMERYRARKSRLDQMVNETLVEQKAKSLGISPEDLAKNELVGKVKTPGEEDVKQVYERFKAQNPSFGTFEEMAPRIREGMSQQAMQNRQEEYVAELRKDAKVEILLTPPRIQVATTGGQESGPKDAPITLVEFSDYQCPFCGRSQATVKQVLDKYEGKIRHVFMDYPLTQIHPLAAPAATASRCAGDQGKYWEYHELLFERQRDLSQENLGKWAAELGLDGGKFDGCMKSNKFEADIRRSVEIGQQAGVTGTPGFFVNGIMINGAQPFAVFQETIDDELARKS